MRAWIAGLPGEHALLLGLTAAALAGGGLLLWWLALRRGRLVADTPTSRIRSAAQGFVELFGSGHWLPGDSIRAPLSGQRCVWWSYRIEELRGSGRNRRWVTISQDRSEELFEILDATGEAVVDPAGAKVVCGHHDRWTGAHARPNGGPGSSRSIWTPGQHRYRYREQRLHLGDPLYVLGWFRTETAVAHTFDRRAEVAAWLRELKADRRRLLQKFDANRDGEICAEEWERARLAAEDAVSRSWLKRSLAPGVHVISRPPNGLPYILSNRCARGLAQRYRILCSLGFALFVCSGSLAVYVALIQRGLPG